MRPIEGVYASHNVLCGVVQPGEVTVYIYLVQRQLIGVGGQHEQVYVIQMVNQLSDTFQVVQGGRSLQSSIRLIDIEGSSPSPCVYPVPA